MTFSSLAKGAFPNKWRTSPSSCNLPRGRPSSEKRVRQTVALRPRSRAAPWPLRTPGRLQRKPVPREANASRLSLLGPRWGLSPIVFGIGRTDASSRQKSRFQASRALPRRPSRVAAPGATFIRAFVLARRQLLFHRLVILREAGGDALGHVADIDVLLAGLVAVENFLGGLGRRHLRDR